jgi:fumarate hydratase class II
VASNLFAAMIAHSLVGLTALVPRIGYDRATRIARHAHVHGLDLRPAALEAGCISAADHDTWVDLRGMSEPV